jgi:hypothetical protein
MQAAPRLAMVPVFTGAAFLEFRGRAIHVFCLNVSERDHD